MPPTPTVTPLRSLLMPGGVDCPTEAAASACGAPPRRRQSLRAGGQLGRPSVGDAAPGRAGCRSLCRAAAAHRPGIGCQPTGWTGRRSAAIESRLEGRSSVGDFSETCDVSELEVVVRACTLRSGGGTWRHCKHRIPDSVIGVRGLPSPHH